MFAAAAAAVAVNAIVAAIKATLIDVRNVEVNRKFSESSLYQVNGIIL